MRIIETNGLCNADCDQLVMVPDMAFIGRDSKYLGSPKNVQALIDTCDLFGLVGQPSVLRSEVDIPTICHQILAEFPEGEPEFALQIFK